jgi:hypothetical protein
MIAMLTWVQHHEGVVSETARRQAETTRSQSSAVAAGGAWWVKGPCIASAFGVACSCMADAVTHFSGWLHVPKTPRGDGESGNNGQRQQGIPVRCCLHA